MTTQELLHAVSTKMDISSEDLALRLPSGGRSIVYDRVHWAKTYLRKAGLLASPERGLLEITPHGLIALKSGKSIDNKYLSDYSSFTDFHKKKKKSS
jgi:restriction system protein